MAIVTIMTMDAKPGRQQEAVDLLKQIREHTNRISGSNPGIYQATYAGEGTGTLSVVFSHDSLAHLGERTAQEAEDSQYQAYMAELAAHNDLPIENVRSAILESID